jgi:electron transfer flavoprotein alpha subunit
MGASRAAVDAGYAPNDWQVGQTGKVVAPRALHRRRHLRRHPAPRRHEGLEESSSPSTRTRKRRSSRSPIYGLVGDLFTLVPELTAKL